jgi:hypothetical protein
MVLTSIDLRFLPSFSKRLYINTISAMGIIKQIVLPNFVKQVQETNAAEQYSGAVLRNSCLGGAYLIAMANGCPPYQP